MWGIESAKVLGMELKTTAKWNRIESISSVERSRYIYRIKAFREIGFRASGEYYPQIATGSMKQNVCSEIVHRCT